MCALHSGQIVDEAAPLTCCFRLHSKHSIRELCCRLHKASNFWRIEEFSGVAASSFTCSCKPRFGANGEKKRPHWRQIELFAAAYSSCLKPQCGHSTLSLTGEEFATGY